MKTLVHRNDYVSVLSEYRGTQAKVWMFHISHSRLAIMLSTEEQSQVIYIVAIGCERISGPFSWENADLSITVEQPNQWGEVRRHGQRLSLCC